MEEFISKADVLLEALPYIQRFDDQIFVVKYGGSFMDSPDPAVRHRVARDVVFLEAVGINPVVVHGGGKAITRAMETAGMKANFIQGQRVTDDATAKWLSESFRERLIRRLLKRSINWAGRRKASRGAIFLRRGRFSSRGRMVRRWILDLWAKLLR